MSRRSNHRAMKSQEQVLPSCKVLINAVSDRVFVATEKEPRAFLHPQRNSEVKPRFLQNYYGLRNLIHQEFKKILLPSFVNFYFLQRNQHLRQCLINVQVGRKRNTTLFLQKHSRFCKVEQVKKPMEFYRVKIKRTKFLG